MARWGHLGYKKSRPLRYNPLEHDAPDITKLLSIYEYTPDVRRFKSSIDPYNPLSEEMNIQELSHDINKSLNELELSHLGAKRAKQDLDRSVGGFQGFTGSGRHMKGAQAVEDVFTSDVKSTSMNIESQLIANESDAMSKRNTYIDDVWSLYSGITGAGLTPKEPDVEIDPSFDPTSEVYMGCIEAGYSAAICNENATTLEDWNSYLGDLGGLDETEIVDILEEVNDFQLCGVGSWCCGTYKWYNPCCWCG